MNFSEDFFKDEVRSDYLVTSKMKKVWAAQLNMLELLDDICKRHNIRYFVEYGTLLGAVRHKGFIPWDDDLDIMMFRDDYEKFKQIAVEEIKEPYFFQNIYTENGMIWAFSKIRDSRTSAIEFPDVPAEQFNQGIFIDIFPFDDAPDDINMKSAIRDIQRDLWRTLVRPMDLLNSINNGEKLACDADIIVDMISLPAHERMREFETFNASLFGKSSRVNFITSELYNLEASRERKWYEEVVWLPFENTMVPAPAGYDEVLKCQYGDYMTPVKGGTWHEGIYLDPDTPYYITLNQRKE